MVTVCGELTAAQLALGQDVFTLAPFSDYQTAKFARKVRKVYLSGGAAANDLVVDLQYGSRRQGINLSNTTTDLALTENVGYPICSIDTCMPDERLMLIVTDAGDTNPYAIKVEIV